MPIYGIDTIVTYLLVIIGFIIVIAAQTKINSAYRKYKGLKAECNLTGQEVARRILDKNGLHDVHVVSTKGELTDHYDPSRKVVRLSRAIFDGTSIASISVAAHECGHAIQDKDGYVFMKIRSALVPVVNLVTYMGYFVTIFALFAGIMMYLRIGILILMATLLFQLVTLPVELDASKRAKQELKDLGLVSDYESNQVKDMLGAAAMTYVASLLNTILNLLRLILLTRNDDN